MAKRYVSNRLYVNFFNAGNLERSFSLLFSGMAVR